MAGTGSLFCSTQCAEFMPELVAIGQRRMRSTSAVWRILRPRTILIPAKSTSLSHEHDFPLADLSTLRLRSAVDGCTRTAPDSDPQITDGGRSLLPTLMAPVQPRNLAIHWSRLCDAGR